ncbi:hypothetical protein RM780_09745 [Streptomyces sp. DSM 44917]|uniref:Uncharacterized protein n=1 Tax=Streptomyces boetiae TaxID=3075541 RepID=A0ABU2L6P8_9ACTN|nr:hypothetical protein [Streptomyces sp. DSM 44917]MDT0307244.1 hypothetical protein [Streptomyces sp. DSM 44917]
MVPIDVSARTRRRYVRNILNVWRSATTEQQQRGRAWYRTAHDLAAALTGGDARTGAGVIAALSANKSWEANVELARAACDTGLEGGHFADALAKAAAILAGADPADVLPTERKTGQFFRCIADPDDPDVVVIDRHAHDIAVGRTYGQRDRGLSSARRYALLADCYREAARQLGELPSTVQAVTWVVHTDRIAGTGTRPQRHHPVAPIATQARPAALVRAA